MRNILHSQSESSPVLAHVAQNVRTCRLKMGISQDELAHRAGLSRRMVNGLEGGSANISLANLDLLATALEVSFVDLVRPPTAQDSDIRAVMWRGAGPDSHAVLLGASPATRQVELWSWSLGAGERYDAQPDAQGYSEMITVTEGELQIVFAGESKHLAVGDFLIFSSAQQYAYLNPGPAPVRFIRNVIS